MEVTNKATRAKSVSDKVFKTTYIQMAQQGKTAEEIANELGMNKASLVSRASAIRGKLAEKNVEFPFAKTARGTTGPRGNTMSAEEVQAYIDSLNQAAGLNQASN